MLWFWILFVLAAIPWGLDWFRLTSVAWPFLLYPSLSFVTYIFYLADKRAAQKGNRRISEAMLHGLELLGGWPGALIAQPVLRHKTRKWSFRLVTWFIVLLHFAFWYWWIWIMGCDLSCRII